MKPVPHKLYEHTPLRSVRHIAATLPASIKNDNETNHYSNYSFNRFMEL